MTAVTGACEVRNGKAGFSLCHPERALPCGSAAGQRESKDPYALDSSAMMEGFSGAIPPGQTLATFREGTTSVVPKRPILQVVILREPDRQRAQRARKEGRPKDPYDQASRIYPMTGLPMASAYRRWKWCRQRSCFTL
jgi:hypothetical protein